MLTFPESSSGLAWSGPARTGTWQRRPRCTRAHGAPVTGAWRSESGLYRSTQRGSNTPTGGQQIRGPGRHGPALVLSGPGPRPATLRKWQLRRVLRDKLRVVSATLGGWQDAACCDKAVPGNSPRGHTPRGRGTRALAFVSVHADGREALADTDDTRGRRTCVSGQPRPCIRANNGSQAHATDRRQPSDTLAPRDS